MKPWLLAVGVSLVVHAALFVSLPPSPPKGERVGQRGDPQFITFTTVTSAPAPQVVREPARVAARLITRAAAPREIATGPAPAESPAAPLEGVPAAAQETGPAGQTAETGPSGVSPLSPAGEREGRVDVSALVHDRLAAVADGCYPAAARRFQQRGTVQLSFCTDANGGAASTVITQSSGAELLDAAARGCVIESAVPFPQEAASRCFSVPVRFGAARP